MAFILKITDGSDTIDFMDESFHVEDGGLQISPPEEVQTWTDASVSGGSRLVDNRYGNRTAEVTFHVSGATRLAMRQGINRISAILRKAILHSLGSGGDRVTLQYAWDGVSIVDNFEVLSGKLVLPDNMLSVEMLQTTWGTNYRLRGCKLQLVLSPNAYGLSPSDGTLIELPLTNRNGNDVTGGLQVTGFTDPGRAGADNFVEIKGTDILGDSPAKVRIEINMGEATSDVDQIYVGAHEKHLGTLSFHWADPAVEIFYSGSTRSSSYVVGGSVWRSGTIPANSVGQFMRVKLANPEVYKSLKYRVFISSGYFPWYTPVNVPMQLTVTSETGGVLAQGPIVQQHHYGGDSRAMIMDLGVVQIPPYSPKMADPHDVYLTLNFLGTAQDDFAMTVGHVWLVPVQNGYRVLRVPQAIRNYVSTDATVIDDNWEGLTYLRGYRAAVLGTYAAVQAMYAPITLTPGKDHRVYFNFIGVNYTNNIATRYTVRVFYSPAYTGAV